MQALHEETEYMYVIIILIQWSTDMSIFGIKFCLFPCLYTHMAMGELVCHLNRGFGDSIIPGAHCLEHLRDVAQLRDSI